MLQCNILQSVMHCGAILQYDSNIPVRISVLYRDIVFCVDEKFLNFQNIIICTKFNQLSFCQH